MAQRTITGTLTIPTSEFATGGIYTDLRLELYLVSGTTETLDQTSNVSTQNTYSFTYNDAGGSAKVKLKRISSGVVLAESGSRGVLPRSFLLTANDSQYHTDFIHQNYLFDAGLSILAATGGRYADLAKEITQGVNLAKTSGALPFHAHHVTPSGATPEFRTGTVAVTAYALGYYLEKNPLATNKAAVAATLNELLIWLCAQRKAGFNNLLKAGKGRMVGATFQPAYVDDVAITADNILAFFAFKQAGVILNSVYLEVAEALGQSIEETLYNSTTKKFYYALFNGGIQSTLDVLDTNVLGALYFIERGDITNATDLMASIEATFKAVDTLNSVEAFKAKINDTLVWFEGSYMASIAYYKLNKTDRYSKLTKALNRQLNEDGSFRRGTIKDGQYAVLDYKSVGSTAWSYMANMVPDEVFTISTGATLTTGVVPVYINHAASAFSTKNDCATGTGSTVEYKVLPGAFNSTADQLTADGLAQADITASAQAYANANGTCVVPYAYFNTQRTALFKSSPCGVGMTGQAFSYSVPAAAYGSNLSQAHADALADAHMRTAGQAYANGQAQCTTNGHVVLVTIETSVNYNGLTDDVFGTFHTSEAVETTIYVEYEYTTDGGANWIANGVYAINQGATNTFSFYITSAPQNSGFSVGTRIKTVTPDTYGSQIYDWSGNSQTSFQNQARSQYFIKECGTAGINAGSMVLVQRPAGSHVSYVSQDDASALADKWIADNGQSIADAQGTCLGTIIHSNQEQKGTFQKQNCGLGYNGTYHDYVVAAGTYQSTNSITEANNYALADVAANGQAYADSVGSCLLSNTAINLFPQVRVDSFGMFDNVYITVYASRGVDDNINVDVAYQLNGMGYLGTSAYLQPGMSQSAESWIGQFNQGEGYNLTATIFNVTPNPGLGGTTYIF